MPHRDTEVRHGPPLEYVVEKVENVVREAHFTLRNAHLVPSDIEPPAGYPATFSVRSDVVESPATAALMNALKALFALLDLDWWSHEYVERITSMSAEELDTELARAKEAGSVTGSNWPVRPA